MFLILFPTRFDYFQPGVGLEIVNVCILLFWVPYPIEGTSPKIFFGGKSHGNITIIYRIVRSIFLKVALPSTYKIRVSFSNPSFYHDYLRTACLATSHKCFHVLNKWNLFTYTRRNSFHALYASIYYGLNYAFIIFFFNLLSVFHSSYHELFFPF